MIYLIAYTTPRGNQAFIGGRFTTKYEAERYQQKALGRWPTATVVKFKNLTEAAKWRQSDHPSATGR